MITYAAHRTSPSGHQPVYRVMCRKIGKDMYYGDVNVLKLRPSHDVEFRSPDFNWGYRGSGTDQLALALLLDAICNPEEAKQFYTSFADDFVTQWKDTWQITDQEIKDWLVMQKGGLLAQVSLN